MTEKSAEKPSVTMPGTVEKIIQSPDPNQPEKAEVARVLHEERDFPTLLKGEY